MAILKELPCTLGTEDLLLKPLCESVGLELFPICLEVPVVKQIAVLTLESDHVVKHCRGLLGHSVRRVFPPLTYSPARAHFRIWLVAKSVSNLLQVVEPVNTFEVKDRRL